MTSPGRFYRPELDALRFFAFLGVFIFHAAPRSATPYDAAGIPHWFGNSMVALSGAGAYGVDLFFALSAYLITGLLLRERAARGVVDLRRFYVRRILRIWPLYLVFIAFAVTVQLFTPAHKLPWHYVLGYCLFAGNWVQAVYGLPISFTAHLWTVSIEEQFYIAWPLVMRKASHRRMAEVAAGMLVAASVCGVLLAAAGVSSTAFKENTFTRIDPIALGILLALFGDRLPRFSRPWRVTFLLAGSAGFVIVQRVCSSSPWGLTLGFPAAALASTAVLAAAIGSQHPLLRNKAILYLGKISYGLYVIHLFGLSCAGHLVPQAGLAGILIRFGLGLALTILLASASYRYLEVPFLKLKERFSYVPSRPV